MMNIIVTALSLISAVHGWTINNPTAVILPPPSSPRYCSRINKAVDVPVRQQHQLRSPQQPRHPRLFVLSAISASSSTSSTDTSTSTEPVDSDQQHDYDECIIDEDKLLSDCAELESFINSASAASTATTDHTATATTDHTATATTDHNSIMVEDTIYEQLHDDKGKSLLSTIIIPKNTADEDKDESSTTTTTTTTIDSTATSTSRSRPAAPAPAAPYYEFNKIIVNTMYNIISFLYPTITTSSTETTATTDTDDDDYSTISLSPKQKQQIQEIQQQQQIQKNLQTNYEHFYILEIIARVPYFAYLSCMHLQETFGSRYYTDINTTVDSSNTDNSNMSNMNYDNTADQVRIEKMRLFYAQADNELHHLLIIEDLLSGDKKDNSSSSSVGIDHRTIVAHSLATIYYWYTVFVYMTHGQVGEQAAYNMNELFVDRTYDTYNTFIEQNENELMETTALVSSVVPGIAHKYYDTDNQYLLNLLYSSSSSSKSSIQPNNDVLNKPPLSNLYDVFLNIRNDEKEHYKTLCKLQQEEQEHEQQ